MSYTLHVPPGNFRAFKILVTAEYNSVPVAIAEPFDPAKAKSLSPTGRAPVLETPDDGVLFESNAIARYVAKLGGRNLTGNDVNDAAEVDSWVDYAGQELELVCSVLFYPVIGLMPFHEDAYEKAKIDIAKALETLDAHLANKTYLVGNRITLADICVASALLYPMKLILDPTFLKPYGHLMAWFQGCMNQPEFKAVVGEVALCKKELTAPGQKVQ